MIRPELIVGCPLRDRLWILPSWFDHVELATKRAGFEQPLIVFAGDHVTDYDSFHFASLECLARDWGYRSLPFDESLGPYERTWDMDRFKHMCMLRNALLREVREQGPDFYWSLDSDILAHEDALSFALDALEHRPFDAVGQRCYMTDVGTWCPSYANLADSGGLLRVDAPGCFPVDCIMASKVMSPRAYAVDYEPHTQGEDLGWSQACLRAGVRLGWDGRTISKHVMGPQYLEQMDERCGF